ncbi:septum formation initiator family protein [Patescibacteria group bacterium AH-259-L07]|nr:septum formation initiator family protein [Patescibacteria group bacterium AH-259-L07]
MTKTPLLKRVISSKIFSYILILLLIFGLVSLGREITYRLSLKKELVRKETQIQTLEAENQELIDELLKRKTEYYKEKQARLKFGLAKPGEEVVVILEDDDELESSGRHNNYFGKKASNITLWFEYFLK